MARRIVHVVTVIVVILLVVVACGSNDSSTSTSAPAATDSTTTTTTTTTTATTATTDAPATTATTHSTTPATPPSTPVQPEPTIPEPDRCDATQLLDIVDGAIEQARLAPGGDWNTDTAGVAFDDRTRTGGEFAAELGLDCSIRAAQRTTTGDERLLVGAWTGERHGFVVQSTDAPATPYDRSVRFELLIAQVHGEWIEPQRSWMTSLDAGESVLLVAHDASIAHVAKAWWSGFPGWEDLPVTNDAERYAIDALVEAGARLVSVAEPALTGSQVAQIQFHTHRGLPLVAVVAPVGMGWFDPMEAIFEGDATLEQIRGVDVLITITPPDHYAIASVGWSCGGYTWWFDALYGDVDEYREFVDRLIGVLGCS